MHRIGRTGRAGKSGLALSFVCGKEVYKLKEIQRYCRTKIKLKPVPSLDDVTSTRVDAMFEELSRIIEEEDLTKMTEMLEVKINEEDFTALDVAAAFLKLHLSSKESGFEDDTDGDGLLLNGKEEGMVRLFINVGKKDRIKPGDILGAIAGEAGISGKLVGEIQMYDKYTFVEVPYENGKDVLFAMKNAKIKGKKVNIEPAKTER